MMDVAVAVAVAVAWRGCDGNEWMRNKQMTERLFAKSFHALSKVSAFRNCLSQYHANNQ
jgi:hypothetical protein